MPIEFKIQGIYINRPQNLIISVLDLKVYSTHNIGIKSRDQRKMEIETSRIDNLPLILIHTTKTLLLPALPLFTLLSPLSSLSLKLSHIRES